MNKQIYVISSILSVIACAICLLFDWRVSTGILIGLLSSLVYFYLINNSFKVKEDGSITKGGVIGFILRIVVIALPLLIACLLPEYFNVFGAFGGVMLFRFVMIFYFLKQKGEM